MHRGCDWEVGTEAMSRLRDAHREDMDVWREGFRWWDGDESDDDEEQEVIGIDAGLTGLSVTPAETDC